MKKTFISLAALTALTLGSMASAQAQDIYGGVGFPGLVTLGYSSPLTQNVGGRIEIGTGLSISLDGNRDGVDVTGKLKSNTVGAFADWFPFENNGFRIVGGITVNDTKAELSAVGTGNTTINNKTVNMTGENYNVKVSFPDVTPYIGIGYGHNNANKKGFGFYADIGVMIGNYTVDTTTSLVANGKLTQADVDAQSQKLRDGIGGIGYMPSASLGITYRF